MNAGEKSFPRKLLSLYKLDKRPVFSSDYELRTWIIILILSKTWINISSIQKNQTKKKSQKTFFNFFIFNFGLISGFFFQDFLDIYIFLYFLIFPKYQWGNRIGLAGVFSVNANLVNLPNLHFLYLLNPNLITDRKRITCFVI